jgi:putative ABC transport system permease protein
MDKGMSMELHPILSAMRRNKVGAIVIVVQTAITMAILCNSLFLIQQRLRSSERPTGLLAAGIVLLLGQIAVLWPALRAASISPVVAIRNI